MIQKIERLLFTKQENSALIVFRVFFGLLMIAECWGAILLGWVNETFVDPQFVYPFFGFEWTRILWGKTMLYYYFIMGLFGIGITIGYKYFYSIFIFSVLWSISYFMQKSHYNNHYYLVMLVSWALVIMPAAAKYSIDANRKPSITSNLAPSWCWLYFKIQFAIVYFYAAIAKIYPDWLDAIPLQLWMKSKSSLALIGPFLQYDWLPYFLAYCGIAFDFLIVPALFFKQSRKIAIGLALIFHLFNSAVFQIGIFPYFALAVSIFYFPPKDVEAFFFKRSTKLSYTTTYSNTKKTLITYTLAVFFVIQLCLPIRHHFISGDVLWNEAGHRLSWRMMLRSKSGHCSYKVKDINGIYRQQASRVASNHQRRDVASRPDMLWTSVQYLNELLTAEGKAAESIFCECTLSVNGRPYKQWIDPSVDILNTPFNYWGTQSWILPAPWDKKQKSNEN